MELTTRIRAAFSDAGDQASTLGRTLSTAHNLAATLRAADPAGPAAPAA